MLARKRVFGSCFLIALALLAAASALPASSRVLECADQSSQNFDPARCACADEASPHYYSQECVDYRGQPFIAASAAIFIALLLGIWWGVSGKFRGQKIQYDFAPEDLLEKKARATAKLLSALCDKGGNWEKSALQRAAKNAFTGYYSALNARNMKGAQSLLRRDLYDAIQKKVKEESYKSSSAALGSLVVQKVEIIGVKCHFDEKQDEFSALIHASARQFEVSGESGERLGRRAAQKEFEEVWSFQREGKGWAACRIEKLSEASQILTSENYCEWLSSKQLSLMAALPDGGVSPSLPIVRARSGRAEAMLSYLEAREGHWEEGALRRIVEGAYLGYYECLSRRDFSKMRHILAPQFYAHASGLSDEMRASGIRLKAKGLKVIGVEFVLVKNRKGAERDEFTAWVSAEAQVVQLNPDGDEIGGDLSAKLFEEYLSFVHSDGWVLEEMTPPDHQGDVLSQPDLDEESPPSWTDWYFRLLPPDRKIRPD